MRTWAARIAYLVVLGSGCAEDQASIRVGTSNACFSDAECGAESLCRQGQCVPASGAPLVLDIEVRPPNRSNLVATRFSDARVPASGPWVLALARPVSYDTVVLDATGAPTAADLLFRPETDGDGRPLDLGFRINADRPSRLLLTPGVYDVFMSPLEDALPPREVSGFEVEPGRELRRKELVLPADYRVLSGTVRARYSTSRLLRGVTIRAVGTETGLASTTAISDTRGEYRLLLPESRDTTFRLRAVLPEELQPAWDFEQIIRVSASGGREKVIEISVPSDVVRGAITLEVIGFGPEGPMPVGDARVTLTATSSLEMASRAFRVVGRTDESGRLRVGEADVIPVLRGAYRAEVEPPVGSGFARLEDVLDLGSVGNRVTEDEQLTLILRPQVRGRVVDAEGRPEPFARVGFTSLEATQGRAPDASTDASGHFEVGLDPGRYLLVAEPRMDGEGRLSPSTATTIEVPAEPSAALEDVVLPPGRLVRGVVRTRDGQPIPDAEVTGYATHRGIRFVAGSARTSDDGTFEMVLPR